MNAIDLIVLNFHEVRRRSLKVWEGIPEEHLHWKPDGEAMTCLEMVRHVLEGDHYYHMAILNRGSMKEYSSPFDGRPLTTVADELAIAEPLRQHFLEDVATFSEEDLSTIEIDRSDIGYVRKLGDMLMRVAYHEAIHTGQLLDYLRTAGVPRPDIWD